MGARNPSNLEYAAQLSRLIKCGNCHSTTRPSHHHHCVALPHHAQGVKLVPALQAIAVGLALRFLVPIPAGVTAQGWSLLSIFVTTILGLVLAPLPVGAWAFIAITVTVATKTLTFAQVWQAANLLGGLGWLAGNCGCWRADG
jgi:hypothetical protein